MKTPRSIASLALPLLSLAACLGGPQADPSAFFLLSSSQATAVGTPVPVEIGLGPLTLPGYLDRAQIVVRVSDNEITLSDVDRWAEPLADNVERTLRENLAALLPGSSFVGHPWYADDPPDVAVAIDFRRFEADATGAVVLEAAWRLTRDEAQVDQRVTRIEEQAADASRAAAVAAHSRALAQLGGEIAQAVRRATGR